jgi:hypothetical protein
MTNAKDKLIERIKQLEEKAQRVKATHKPNPPNVIGFPTLDDDIFNEWKANAENLILKVSDSDSPYYKNFIKEVKDGHRSNVDSGVGILRALKEDIELGLLLTVKELAIAEVFTDFLDMAKHLLDAGYKDPSASLVGAVLEDGLRKICEKNSIQVKGSDDIGALNTKLADKEVYNRLVQKQIQAWKAIRDSADHGKFGDYKKEDIGSMLEGVQRFLTENL